MPFERYADDVIVHWKSAEEAAGGGGEAVFRCKLTVHPQKTKIVYCKDANRRGSYETESFDFLGFTFRPRTKAWGIGVVRFLPAVSRRAAKSIRNTIGRGSIAPERTRT